MFAYWKFEKVHLVFTMVNFSAFFLLCYPLHISEAESIFLLTCTMNHHIPMRSVSPFNSPKKSERRLLWTFRYMAPDLWFNQTFLKTMTDHRIEQKRHKIASLREVPVSYCNKRSLVQHHWFASSFIRLMCQIWFFNQSPPFSTLHTILSNSKSHDASVLSFPPLLLLFFLF